MVNYLVVSLQKTWRVHLGHDRMVVGCTTICVISVYHHYISEFEHRSWRGVLNTTFMIKFVSDLRQVGGFFSRYSCFLHQ